MNKDIILDGTASGDALAQELRRAADYIVNHLSDEELERLIASKGRTFRQQVTPQGEPLTMTPCAELLKSIRSV